MMELIDSGIQLSESTTTTSQAEIRSPLGIDLNEIPSCPPGETLFPELDALTVVRSYHDNLTPADGAPAEVPGDESGEKGCAACRLPEVRGLMVVCDGCERGFHLNCTGKGRQPESSDEWVCGECVCVGVKSKRWPLGFSSNSSLPKRVTGGIRLLDINSSPPSDGEGEGSEELQDSRKHVGGDISLDGNPFDIRMTYSNNLYAGGYSFQRASGIMNHGVKFGFENLLHHTQAMAKSCEEIKFGFPIGIPKYSNETAIRIQSRSPNEIFLQSLKEFISEKHGVLGEGWSVEVRQTMGSCELCAVYCSPDGRFFGSMSEVAYYLGLISNGNSFDSEVIIKEGSASVSKRSHLNKKRKSNKVPIANGVIENKKIFTSENHGELSSDIQMVDIYVGEFGNDKKYNDIDLEGNCGTGCQQLDDALPLQYEDFFILSFGKIDTRPSYHDVNNIFPIGYKSCFHDKITGSFFICNVLDGGDRGPIFKVRRCSCSSLPIPIGSTILFSPRFGHTGGRSFYMDSEEDESIQILLSGTSPPLGDDIMSCLGCNHIEAHDVHSNLIQVEAKPLNKEEPRNLQSGHELGDEIGDFSEEGHIPSLVWKIVCQKIVEACCEIYKRTGTLDFYCKHFDNTMISSCRNMNNEKIQTIVTSLSKFSSLSGSVNTISMIPVKYELETLSNVLTQWLDQDRFGLEVEFVQEIIEQLPGVQTCSQYEVLNKRMDYSALQTIGNGVLLVKTENGVQDRGKALNGIFKGYERAKRTQIVEDAMIEDRCLPIGKPLGTRLSSDIVGDVLQVWEFFWRFYETLGLKEPFPLEKLEEELIKPWCDELNAVEKLGKEENQDVTSNGTGVTNCANGIHIVSSNDDSSSALSIGDSHAFIELETRAMKEEAQAKLASLTYSKCTGLMLTKAHNSLLKALVTELQSKVAALVDPSFDAGEFKPRRGKRKDCESSTVSKKNKLNMLPINELTWPELARRYVLSVLTMDGNLDSPDITNRECGKVFRCLQGDGGVLCGSLTGVAGMKADALLLAEATKQTFISLNRDSVILTIEDEEPDVPKTCEVIAENNAIIPEWARVLEPVRKLPTNVGTRIRKCVYEALEKDPPEWAREKLEYSISKGVYKGNASGPTKKAVLLVLANISAESQSIQRKPEKERERKRKSIVSVRDIIMKKCRIILRRSAAENDANKFCNLLGQNLMNSCDNDDEGFLGSPAIVPRPLDFRIIDMRLAVGAYIGSHEAFLEDVRELWNNVRIAFVDQPDMIESVDALSQKFESLYENEVIVLVEKLMEYAKLESFTKETKKEIDDIVVSTSDIPKAPWDDGVCKVCGIDKNDDSVLLCDTCDAEYHTYCLNPPLVRIPEGNWYCPSCALRKFKAVQQEALGRTQAIGRGRRKKYQGDYTRDHLEALANLSSVMEEKEYWEYNIYERTFLLKFMCDELLSSSLVHQHLEQCAESSAELQQKLRSASLEWKNLKVKEDILISRASKIDSVAVDTCSNDLPLAQEATQDVTESCDPDKEGKNVNVQNESPLPDPSINDTQMEECVAPVIANESQPYDLELNSLKGDMVLLQESILSLESQILKQTIRREFLGSDASGRLYWVTTKPDQAPYVIVDASSASNQEQKIAKNPNVEQNCEAICSSWMAYQSDEEIEELIKYFKENDPKERELKESILHLRKLRYQDNQQAKKQDDEETQEEANKIPSFDSLVTKASSFLEKSYGPCFDTEHTETSKKRRKKGKVVNEQTMYRCDCLEPMWPSKYHCMSCHQTFLSDVDLEGHRDGKCTVVAPSLASEKVKENSESSKGKGVAKSKKIVDCGDKDKTEASKNEKNSNLIQFQNGGLGCPYNFEEISSKFITKDSNKDLVQEIGLISSNGIPSLIPSVSPYLDESTQMLISQKTIESSVDANKPAEELIPSQGKMIRNNMAQNANKVGEVLEPTGVKDKKFSLKRSALDKDLGHCCVVSESALRPLVGKVSQILRRLKINLLDMDAALPEEALRLSKVDLEKRWAWRSFVKSAQNIFQMVQATIILEDMIKTEFLRNSWWYWSSLSAAAKISTISSLSLRIYTLDASIIYEKIPLNLDQSEKSIPGSDQSEKSKVSRKASKRRKETDG